ncbi:MAG: LPS-assembly protein LptD, partial [bacterium]
AAFPINDQRKSGFLFPTFGYDDDSGAIIEVPYYFNLAPNYDATLTPRILSKRGAQVSGEFRHLGIGSRSELRGEYLPSDNQRDDDDRYSFGLDHHHRFGAKWDARVNWQSISDRAYLRDFANEVDLVASSYVAQRARLDYHGDALRFNARAISYDVAAEVDAHERPHKRLPQLTLTATPRRIGRFEIAADAEYTDFRHNDRMQPSGARLRLRPSIALPLRRAYGALVPRASVQTIRYALDDAVNGERTPSVTAPIFSLDGRLYFERATAHHAQTLEPRLRYLNIPRRRKQNDFPVFDADGGDDTSFGHYFRDNRFFGGDRIGDTEQLALGVTSRIIAADSGRQRLRMSLGQVFYFDDRAVVLPDADAAAQTARTSGALAEIAAAIAPKWEAGAFAKWRDGSDQLDAFRLSANYAGATGTRGGGGGARGGAIAYTFRDRDSEQINLSWKTPLAARWQLQAATAYSLREHKTNSSVLGVGFDACCWALRIGAQRYLDGAGARKSRFLLTLELDDLGRISSRL